MSGLHATAQSIGINPARLPLTPTIGKWYRLPLIGKPNSNTSGRAKALGAGVVYLQNMATGDKVTYFDDKPTDKAELTRWHKQAKAAQAQAKREQDKQYHAAAIRARCCWFDSCVAPDMNHAYLVKKRLKPYGLRQLKHELVVPVYSLTDGKIQSLQFIAPNASKRFLTGGKSKDGFYTNRPFQPANDKRIIIAEGWATSQSLSQQWKVQGWHLVAFNSGNLLAVAKSMRLQFPKIDIIIAADNDESGNGQEKATQAAKAVNGKLSMPLFTSEERDQYGKVSDWQDRWMIDQRNRKELSRYAD